MQIKIIYILCTTLSVLSHQLFADLGPIRFAGDANAIIQPEAVITVSGNYRLARTINPTVNGITIAVDDVSLDLNNFTINGGGVALFGINAASTRKNIIIKNGYIKNCVTAGISIGTTVGNSSENIVLENVTTLTNSEGLQVINTQNFQCINCKNSFNGNGVRFDRIRNTVIADCEFDSNTASGLFIQASTAGQTRGITVNNCQANNNAAAGFRIENAQDLELSTCQAAANVQGFTLSFSKQIQYKNCTASQNIGQAQVGGDGFFAEVSSDVLYDHCFSTSNMSPDLTTGFRSTSGVKTIYRSCIATDNTGTNTGIGFNLSSETNSCVIDCLAKRNNGAVNGTGIRLATCLDCVVQDNFSVENFGVTSFGIAVTGGASLTTSVLGNRAQNHGVNNYVISPGTIPAVRYTINPFFISSAPTPVDNIDIR